ncbi:thiol reductant ABC exporter subunit CydC [Ruania alkalisoli]|uniref:Thiol reductant ABC exporter subunit CydC n=1 Tax=Ruania alkalisoli TaxID=2779775 RepID=A0A7M1T1H4_9MICO|nr:thiol reductant ABC exporter subunit CydC [Ruania alkalisoli]
MRAVRAILPLLNVSRRRALVAVAWGSLTLSAAVGLAAVSAWLIARASQMPHVLDLTVAVVTVRALGISRGLFRYLDRLASHDVALRGVAALRERLYRTLAGGRPEATLGLRRGDLLSRIGADADTLGDVVVRGLLPAAVAAVVSTGSVILVGAFSPAIGAVLALTLLIAGVLGPVLAARAARLAEVDGMVHRLDVSVATSTILDGATELRVQGGMPRARAALAEAESGLRGARDRAAVPAALAHGIGLLTSGIATVAALMIGIPAMTAGTLTPVELAVVVLTPMAAFEATAALPAAAVQLTRSASSARRILALLHAAGPARCPESSPRVRSERQNEATQDPKVIARGLACGWPGRTVVGGIDLQLEPGRAVVLLGPSGSGKTTTALTLAGLIDPIGGELEIRGGSTPTDVVTFTPEDAHLFSTTVLENLRVARGDVSAAEAHRMLERVGLNDLVAALPEGLNTLVSAETLSGGERRRLLLARALCSPAPLLILDEPTEHLDADTALTLQQDILTLGRERGVLLITHDERGIDAADEVLRLDASARLDR